MGTHDLSNDQSTVFQAFSHALVREVHVLIDQPEIFWQQLYNRLPWEDDHLDKPVSRAIASEFRKRTSSDIKPWLHNKSRIMESEAFIKVLMGHSRCVTSCAFLPDGRTLASASWDKTLRLWGVYNGKLIYTFPCLGGLETCCLSPLGDKLAIGDTGGNVYILELIGFERKAIIVTEVEGKRFPEFICPECQQEYPIKKEQLDSEMTCPTPDCGLRLKLNPFTIKMD